MDFLDPQEAEKFNKQKWKQFWWTHCRNLMKVIFTICMNRAIEI